MTPCVAPYGPLIRPPPSSSTVAPMSPPPPDTPPFLKLGVLATATGSAYLEAPGVKLMAACHGPLPLPGSVASSGAYATGPQLAATLTAPWAAAPAAAAAAAAAAATTSAADGSGSGGGGGGSSGSAVNAAAAATRTAADAVAAVVGAALAPAIIGPSLPRCRVELHLLLLEGALGPAGTGRGRADAGGDAADVVTAAAITVAAAALADAGVAVRDLVAGGLVPSPVGGEDGGGILAWGGDGVGLTYLRLGGARGGDLAAGMGGGVAAADVGRSALRAVLTRKVRRADRKRGRGG